MALHTRTQWVRDGRPYQVAEPVADLHSILTGHGYTVYLLGDERHLRHIPPEDHCPFSAVGWPVESPYPWLFAADIMPPPAGSGLPSLQQLGAQLHGDKQAGHPGMQWLKYMNWGPDRDNGGPCYHDSWQPEYARRNSTDRGHIHLSGRSDCKSYSLPDGYDPVARIRGERMTGPADVWNSREVDIFDNWRMSAADKATPGANKTVRPLFVLTEIAKTVDAIGDVVTKMLSRPPGTVTMTAIDRAAIVKGVVDQLRPELVDAARAGAAAAIESTRLDVQP